MFGAHGVVCFCSDEDLGAYRRLYNLEAYLRHMVRWELVGLFGHEWFDKLGGIRTSALKTRKDEQELRIIDYDRRNALSYTVANDLQTTIDGVLWAQISGWMPPAEILFAELTVLRALRNKSAHLRRLTPRDLRSLDRIELTFVHCTANYREVRREAVSITSASSREVPASIRPALRAWVQDANAPDGRWTTLTMQLVGSYLRIDARLRVGAFHPEAVARAVDAAGTDAFFLCLDEPVGLISVYIPNCLERARATSLVNALRNMTTIGDALQEDSIEVEYFDFVFPGTVELPAALRL